MVNQNDGTNPEADLMTALANEERGAPTEEAEQQEEGTEAETDGSEAEQDEDAELEEAVADEDAAEAEDEAEADETSKRYTVPGQEQKLSLQELKDGWMKDADYRRKTAEVAETRKKAEAVTQRYESSLSELENKLTLVGTFLANASGIDEAQLDKMAEENPAEFVRVKRDLEKRAGALQAVQQQLAAVQQARQDKQSETMRSFRDAENAKLVEVAPQFKNPEVRQRLNKYLNEAYGLSQEDVESVADHRFAIIAEKARRLDAILAKSATKDKQVQKVAKVQRGGNVIRNEQAVQQKQALGKVMKSGRVEDLASLL